MNMVMKRLFFYLAVLFSGILLYAEDITVDSAASRVSRSADIQEELALTFRKTGMEYQEQQNYVKAMQFYCKSLAIQRELGNKMEIGRLLTGMGIIANKRLHHFEALAYYREALDIFYEIDPAESTVLRLTGEGTIYREPEQYIKALEYHVQTEYSSNRRDAGLNLISVYDNIGKTYTLLGEYDKAETYLQKARRIIEESNLADKTAVREHYLFYTELYAVLGEYKEAYEHYRTYVELKDAVFTGDPVSMIAEMGEKYNAAQRKKESERIRKKSIIALSFLVPAILLLFFLSYYIYTRYRQKLQQQEMKRRVNFFMNLAHEIKTPLTLIRSYFSHYVESQKPSDSLDLIGHNIDRLIGYIHNFFTLEKLERRVSMYDHSKRVNLKAVCEEVTALTEPACDEKKISIVYEGPDSDVFIPIDPDALNTVLYNLLQNAVKYTGEGGLIEVRLTQTDSRAQLSVKDTGIGIDAADLASVFKPFARLLSDKNRVEGLGLGLSIVKNIVDQTGGRIGIKSKPGVGTDCTVLFTKCTAPANGVIDKTRELSTVKVQKSRKCKKVIHKAHRPTILIVDDEPDILYCIQKLFSEARYNAYFAENGKEALETLKIIPRPDVIIADIMMGPVNGYVLLDSIKQIYDSTINTIPIIFLSARSDADQIVKGLQLGAVEYIPKPFDNRKLLARVGALIEHTRKKEKAIRKMSTKIAEEIKSTPINEHACLQFNITPRQKDILRGLQQGHRYQRIAENLGISNSTVRSQVFFIKERTGLNDASQLVQLFFYDSRR